MEKDKNPRKGTCKRCGKKDYLRWNQCSVCNNDDTWEAINRQARK